MAGELRRTATHDILPYEDRKPLPSNIDMEQAVLGTLLMSNNTWQKVQDVLTEDHFFEDLHRRIFKIIAGLLDQGQVANPITVRTFLEDTDLGGGVTASQYVSRLAGAAGIPTELRNYAKILNDLRVRRELISIALNTMELAYAAPVDATAKGMVDLSVDRLAGLRSTVGEGEDFKDFSTVTTHALDSMFADWQNQGKPKGVSTGYPSMDEAIGGLEAPDFILIGGRPGSGKTALATNIAFNVAKLYQAEKEAGHPRRTVGFFSLEMSNDQLWQRVISDATGIPSWRLKRRALSDKEMEKVANTAMDLKQLPIEIDDTGKLSISQLELRARALKKSKNLGLLVIDYVQLLGGRAKGRGRGDDNRVQELTDITTSLKALAKELEIPIVALAQLSREVDKRDDKRPKLGDLRESGSLEQDADMVMLIYREEYYLKDMKPMQEGSDAYFDWERRMTMVAGVAEVNIAKQRHGPPTTLTMGFHAELTRFLDTPVPRDYSMDPVRREKKAAGPKLSTKSMQAHKILKALSLNHSTPNKGLENVPAYVKRPVSYILWREKCAEQLLDVSRDEKAAAKLMEEVLPQLVDADFVVRKGTKDHPYVWLTELGAK